MIAHAVGKNDTIGMYVFSIILFGVYVLFSRSRDMFCERFPRLENLYTSMLTGERTC